MDDIVMLPRAQYEGYAFPFYYESELYYDVRMRDTANGFTVDFVRMPFPQTFVKKETDKLFSQSADAAEAHGIFDGDKLVAILEISPVFWNNRLRILNIWVDQAYRRLGLGRRLIRFAKRAAATQGRRAVVLEVQSCNSKAIAFYLSQGFMLSGFDAYAYSNEDIEKKEVRLEMVYRPSRSGGQ